MKIVHFVAMVHGCCLSEP